MSNYFAIYNDYNTIQVSDISHTVSFSRMTSVMTEDFYIKDSDIPNGSIRILMNPDEVFFGISTDSTTQVYLNSKITYIGGSKYATITFPHFRKPTSNIKIDVYFFTKAKQLENFGLQCFTEAGNICFSSCDKHINVISTTSTNININPQYRVLDDDMINNPDRYVPGVRREYRVPSGKKYAVIQNSCASAFIGYTFFLFALVTEVFVLSKNSIITEPVPSLFYFGGYSSICSFSSFMIVDVTNC